MLYVLYLEIMKLVVVPQEVVQQEYRQDVQNEYIQEVQRKYMALLYALDLE